MSPQQRSPRLTVDVLIQMNGSPDEVVLVKRRFPPHGWAIPGGFVNWGETVEAAAVREALEETSLHVKLVRQFHVYSDPARDPRGHTVSVVFVATGKGIPHGQDDAAEAGIFRREALPSSLAFDHSQIISDYFDNRY
jgi:ADP-ribose pyrophosphatase YjhB (NUDIX family)